VSPRPCPLNPELDALNAKQTANTPLSKLSSLTRPSRARKPNTPSCRQRSSVAGSKFSRSAAQPCGRRRFRVPWRPPRCRREQLQSPRCKPEAGRHPGPSHVPLPRRRYPPAGPATPAPDPRANANARPRPITHARTQTRTNGQPRSTHHAHPHTRTRGIHHFRHPLYTPGRDAGSERLLSGPHPTCVGSAVVGAPRVGVPSEPRRRRAMAVARAEASEGKPPAQKETAAGPWCHTLAA